VLGFHLPVVLALFPAPRAAALLGLPVTAQVVLALVAATVPVAVALSL